MVAAVDSPWAVEHGLGNGIPLGLVLPCDVDEEGVAPVGLGPVAAMVITSHEGAPSGWEEPGLGVDLLKVVLGPDEGVLAGQAVDLAGHVFGVGGQWWPTSSAA
jgi:hypothetical protein